MTIAAMCVFYAVALSGYYNAHSQMTKQLVEMQNELSNVRKINAQILSGNYQVLIVYTRFAAQKRLLRKSKKTCKNVIGDIYTYIHIVVDV